MGKRSREEHICWKCSNEEPFENHLGVTLIQSGDSVIVINERSYEKAENRYFLDEHKRFKQSKRNELHDSS